MRRSILGLVAALSLPLCAAAQDTATDVARAMALFYPELRTDPGDYMANGAGRIPAFEGRWIPAQILFPEADYDAGQAAQACDRVAVEIASDGPFAFTLTRMRGGEPTEAVVTYTFAGGTTYSRSADLEGFAAYLFPGKDPETLPPHMLLSALTGPGMNGYALVHLYAPDVLVIEAVQAPPMILSRCPS